MTPSRPYLIRALVEWITDNSLTPYVLVDCRPSAVAVPRDYVKDDKIVLNLSVQATRYVEIGNEAISLECRFGGKPTQVDFPVGSVLAVYAKENGAGMSFELDETLLSPDTPSVEITASTVDDARASEANSSGDQKPAPSAESGTDDDDDPPPNRPTLRVVR